jgi:hypothetical protein
LGEHSLAHTDQAESRRSHHVALARARDVGDADRHLLRPDNHEHVGGRPWARMLDDVRERFLNDPIGHEIRGRRQPRVSVDDRLRGNTGEPDALS